MPQLRSGEYLCDVLNLFKPGLVPKVARAAELAGLHESKRNARMRENIGQYVDGCAELGMPQRELFMTADLFEGKDTRAVLRHLEGLARFVQDGVRDFDGPYIGKKAKKRPPGAGGPSALPGCYGAILSSQSSSSDSKPVILSRGGAGYQSVIGGRR